MKETCDAWDDRGLCGMFDDCLPMDEQPSGCDENGCCLDEYDNGCDNFDIDEDVCDFCGEPLGFCSLDCSGEEEIE